MKTINDNWFNLDLEKTKMFCVLLVIYLLVTDVRNPVIVVIRVQVVRNSIIVIILFGFQRFYTLSHEIQLKFCLYKIQQISPKSSTSSTPSASVSRL